MYVRFVQPPNVDAIRNDLQARGLGEARFVPIHDVAAPNTNELEIGLEGSAENEQGLDADKLLIINTLHQSFPPAAGDVGKKDFNGVGPSDLADDLDAARSAAFEPRQRATGTRNLRLN